MNPLICHEDAIAHKWHDENYSLGETEVLDPMSMADKLVKFYLMDPSHPHMQVKTYVWPHHQHPL